ncbi:Crp/Fnr family transcriptional regulator [Sphingobacterium multivorum]|uniref:Crp/Fnr family transcriptional regulator n=1 Tax=Sphingobacterium multivorum TaxID=28454 RepID=A0ABX7CW42_SPHMU|nr:Crp/Fnr family transcriptional regulator [Sphingobacterium multivorum]QQT55289.1 Crp/Fnr family transcriptional regulator [Sphingobacterium multivorum]
MEHGLILENIAKHITLDDNEVAQFLKVLKKVKIPRRSMILTQGQLCNSIYFVDTGALRAFYLDVSGRESTIMFAIKDWWITDMYCFINALPAMLTIDTIEDSIIYQLQKNDLEKLYLTVPKFERFFRILMQNAYIREQLRVIQNLSLTAEERFDIFLNKYPDVANKVKQKQIASYLGITPEFLSMIKRKKQNA